MSLSITILDTDNRAATDTNNAAANLYNRNMDCLQLVKPL